MQFCSRFSDSTATITPKSRCRILFVILLPATVTKPYTLPHRPCLGHPPASPNLPLSTAKPSLLPYHHQTAERNPHQQPPPPQPISDCRTPLPWPIHSSLAAPPPYLGCGEAACCVRRTTWGVSRACSFPRAPPQCPSAPNPAMRVPASSL